MSIVPRKRGDDRPFEATLVRGSKKVNLTEEGAEGVKFLMAPKPGNSTNAPTVNGTAELIDPAKGKVQYHPRPSDVAVPGTYNAEWEVRYADGSIETFPNREYIDVVIYQDLNPASPSSQSPSASQSPSSSPSASPSPSPGP